MEIMTIGIGKKVNEIMTREELINLFINSFLISSFLNLKLVFSNDISPLKYPSFLTDISNTLNKLEKKYGDSLKEYETFLNNRLKYDDDYYLQYSKILEARAELEKAYRNGDSDAIKVAEENSSRNSANVLFFESDLFNEISSLYNLSIDSCK